MLARWASNSSTLLSAPKRKWVPIMKASARSCICVYMCVCMYAHHEGQYTILYVCVCVCTCVCVCVCVCTSWRPRHNPVKTCEKSVSILSPLTSKKMHFEKLHLASTMRLLGELLWQVWRGCTLKKHMLRVRTGSNTCYEWGQALFEKSFVQATRETCLNTKRLQLQRHSSEAFCGDAGSDSD